MESQLGEVTSHLDWAGIFAHNRPYLQTETPGSIRAASDLSSQVSIEQITAPELGGDAVKVSYAAGNRDLVLGVLNDVAEGFAKPITTMVAAKAAEAPLYAPVILPTPAPEPEPIQPRVHKGRRNHWVPAKRKRTAPAVSTAELSNRLQASVAEGDRLREESSQNASLLQKLQASLDEAAKQEKNIAPATPKAAPEVAAIETQHKPSPLEERLRVDVARAQHELDDLRTRYTDQYPDVVAAKERLSDLQLDLQRIAALPPAPTIPKPVQEPQRQPEARQDSKALLAELHTVEAAQGRLQRDVARNESETVRLRTELAKAGQLDISPSTEAGNLSTTPDSPAGSTTSPNAAPAGADTTPPTAPAAITTSVPSPFFLVRQPAVAVRPAIFATGFLWPLCLGFGILAALLAAWLAEQRDPSIRSEGMLRRELPPSAAYLGGIPRIKHEVIID